MADLGITAIGEALRPRVTDVTVLAGLDGEEPNVRLTLTPSPTTPFLITPVPTPIRTTSEES